MNKNKCWICKEVANSKEHKHKAALLRRNFGKKYNNNELSVFKSGVEHKLKSYKGKELLFSKKICISCNNVLTKPHDNAYDDFTNFTDNSFEYLQSRNEINLQDIFGSTYKLGYNNLVKYFAKNLGCRIISSENATGIDIDIDNLSKLIKDEIPNTFLKLKFVFKEEIESFMKDNGKQIPNIFIGQGIVFGDTEEDINYGTWYSYQWLSVYCVYTNRKLNPIVFDQISPLIKIEKQKIGALSKHRSITIGEGCDIIEAYQHPTDELLKSYCTKILND